MPFDAFAIILDSFLNYIFEVNDFMLIKEVSQNVSKHLLSQSSGFQMLETKVQPQHKVSINNYFISHFILLHLH